MSDQRQWHRLFGMSWTDLLNGLPVDVELEKDLSIKQQFLDVAIVRKEPGNALAVQLPDGFEELANHNLISFKSYQEALEGWSLLELLAHFVNYRKQVSPSMDDLLPEDHFRLFAVCVRFPQGLSRQVELQRVQEGVYRVPYFTGTIRLIVVHQLPQQAQNAMLHLFSAREELVRFGAQPYRPRSRETSTFLHELYDRYREEGMPMPFTKEEFIREAMARMLHDPVVVKLVLEGIPVADRLEGVPVADRLAGLTPEQRLQGLSPQERADLLKRLQADAASDDPAKE
jgi:hypothetical protein